MIPYTRSADLLGLLLPVEAGNAPSTVPRRALSVAQRLDAELREGVDTARIKCSRTNTDPVTEAGLDSGYVKERSASFRPTISLHCVSIWNP